MKTHHFFFSFRTCDQSEVEKLREGIRRQLPNFPFEDSSLLVPFSADWQSHATEAIARCDGLICIVGETTFSSEPVNWEIEEAHRLGKPLIVAGSEKHELPRACKELGIKAIPSQPRKVAERMCDLLVPKTLVSQPPQSLAPDQAGLVWNQYSLMVQSWEALVGRRQTVNNLYLTGNATILAGIGVFIGNVKDMGSASSLSGAIILAILGVLLSLNWLQTIVSYGTLSQAKAKVVLALETFLPAKLFDTEWAVLESNKYRSTTKMDKRTSQFFIALFVVLLGSLIAMSAKDAPAKGQGSPAGPNAAPKGVTPAATTQPSAVPLAPAP